MRRLFTAASLILLISGCSKTPEQKWQALFERGLEQIENCEFVESGATFQRLIVENPTSAQGLYGKGLLLESQYLFYDALQVYLAIIEMEPSFVPARGAAARVYTRLEKTERAATEYARAVAFANVDMTTKVHLIGALIDNRDLNGAQQAFEKLNLSDSEEAVAKILRARLQWLRRETDSAAETFGQALMVGPKTAEFYAQVADFYETAGLIDSAIIYSTKSLSAEDTDFRYRQTHLFRCLKHNYLYAARQVIKAVAVKDITGSAVNGMRVFYSWAARDSYKAGRTGTKFRGINDGTLSVVLYDVKTRWMRADLLTCTADLDVARRMIIDGDYTQSFKDFASGEVELISMIMGEPKPVESIEETAGWKNGEREYGLAYAYLLRRHRLYERFDSVMVGFLTKHGEESSWLLAMADLYADQIIGLPAEAEKHYRMALQQDSYFQPALRNWVEMYKRLGKFDKALEVMRSYAYLTDIFPELALTRAELMVRTGEIDSAIELFNRNIAHLKGNMNWYRDFSEQLMRKWEMDLSKAVVSRAPELNPGNPDAYLLAARVYVDHGEFDTALKMAEEGLSLEPENVNLQVQSIRAVFGKGEHEKAIEKFEELRGKVQVNVDLSLYYSHCLASIRRDLHKATNLAREAIFHDQGSLRSLLNSCYVSFQCDKFNNVRGEAQKATRLYPDSPEACFYLGMAYYKKGDTRAKEQLQKAIKLGLWGEKLNMARGILAEI